MSWIENTAIAAAADNGMRVMAPAHCNTLPDQYESRLHDRPYHLQAVRGQSPHHQVAASATGRMITCELKERTLGS